MPKFALITALFTLFNLNAISQNATYTLDYTNPESVVNAMFYAAQTKDYAILQCLCDPFGDGDGDVKQLCSISQVAEQIEKYGGSAESKATVDEFVSMFTTGRITGQVTFSKGGGEEFAHVPVYINHPGGPSRSDENIKLVKRYGNWYWFGF